MATLLVLLLLVLAFCFFLAKRLQTGIAILLVALICFVAVGDGLVASILLRHLQAPFIDHPALSWRHKNAIVLLGAGAVKLPGTNITSPSIMAYSRIQETARLYFSCVKSHNVCEIVISGGDALKMGTSEAVVYKAALLQLGVSHANIILEPNSLNTYQNAKFTSAILKKRNVDQVILVTSGIHLRRSLLYFAHFGIDVKPAMADFLTAHFSVVPIGYNFAMTDFAIHEYLGIARFHVYHFFGWNKAVNSAGAV